MDQSQVDKVHPTQTQDKVGKKSRWNLKYKYCWYTQLFTDYLRAEWWL